jgi:hypothetical protein
MLQEIQDKKVTLYLSFSAWGDHEVSGEVVAISDSWLKLKVNGSWPKHKGKRSLELIPINTIKRIKIHIK